LDERGARLIAAAALSTVRELRRFDVLHIATPAVIDNEHPELEDEM
jgi:hypothetical protein